MSSAFSTSAMAYYSIALILMGMVALVTELRVKEYNRIPGFLAICGVCVCMYVCICVCMCVRACVRAYIYIYMFSYF